MVLQVSVHAFTRVGRPSNETPQMGDDGWRVLGRLRAGGRRVGGRSRRGRGHRFGTVFSFCEFLLRAPCDLVYKGGLEGIGEPMGAPPHHHAHSSYYVSIIHPFPRQSRDRYDDAVGRSCHYFVLCMLLRPGLGILARGLAV